ncbi:MAG: lipoprotein-releasing ABC transporter permease subunit [Dongiaceae bacterium]
MFSTFEWLVALRYLRSRRRNGLFSAIAVFSLLGICLAVATLIIVLSVFNGFRNELLDRILGLNGHLNVTASDGRIEDYDQVSASIESVPGVRSVTPTVGGETMATAARYAVGVYARGLTEGDINSLKLVSGNLKAGSLDKFTGKSIIALGARLADRLHVGVGDDVTLILQQTTCTVFGCVPRSKTYRVVAIFQVGMSLFDERFAYMPLEAAQLFFQAKGAATDLVVRIDDPDAAEAFGAAIRGTIGEQFRITDWRRLNASYFDALEVQRLSLMLIFALITIVAALNVISGQVLMVKDKTREIAILRTMGARRGSVLRIFLMNGLGIGSAGTIAGVILGYLACANIESVRRGLERLFDITLFPADVYFLSRLPAEISAADLTGVVLFAMILSILATAYPAWRGARLDPVEALRYE